MCKIRAELISKGYEIIDRSKKKKKGKENSNTEKQNCTTRIVE